MRNGPDSFAGRKLGVLVTDGTDADVLDRLTEAVGRAEATFELVAPTVGGATTSDGKLRAAQQNIDGGPSVLYDTVAVLPAADAVAALTHNAATKDFVSDAYAHCKVIGYVATALPLLEACGVAPDDDGVIALDDNGIEEFLRRCGELRVWSREGLVHQT